MTRRGQLVLLAAVALVVALVPLTLAHLQLGYRADVSAAGDAIDERPLAEAEHALAVALDDAVDGVPKSNPWADRSQAVTVVKNRLASTLDALNQSGLSEGVISRVSYNQSRARTAVADCPSGPDRRFGPCRAEGGVVVQERAGQTHVVAVAFDVRSLGQDAERTLTTVVHVGRPRG